jgi:hypothetical protein
LARIAINNFVYHQKICLVMKNVFTLIGFLVAVVLSIGFLQKSNYKLVRDGAAISEASLFSSDGAAADNADHAPSDRISLREEDNPANDPFDPPALGEYRERRGSTSRTPAHRSGDASKWLSTHGPIAVMEAVRLGVPAGVSLAVGLLQLEQGRLSWNDDFAAKIIAPLANRKSEAPARFKYRANSQPWMQGLGELGLYREAELERLFRQYNLGAYDAEVYMALQDDDRAQNNRGRVAQAAIGAVSPARAASKAAPEVADEALRRNVAGAMNQYADRELAERGASLRVVAATEASAGSATAARRKASALKVGQSMTFESPREFQLVLRELIALEEGYPSWAAYQQDDADGARRQFNRRSDVMASGGAMRITRRQ